MNQLSVRVKILLLAVIMLLITCMVAAVGIYSNHLAKQSIDDMYNYNLMTTQYLSDANNQLRGLEVDIAYVLQQDYALQGKLLFQENNVTYDRTIKTFLGIILFGLLVGIGAATIIAGNIATPLQESVNQLQGGKGFLTLGSNILYVQMHGRGMHQGGVYHV